MNLRVQREPSTAGYDRLILPRRPFPPISARPLEAIFFRPGIRLAGHNARMRMLSVSSELEAMREMLAAEQRPGSVSHPWVMVNMVTGLDGSVTSGGRAEGLSGAADQAHFHAVRELSDVVLAGSATVRVERYRQPSLPTEVRQARIAAGRKPDPHLLVVTRHPADAEGGFEGCDLDDDPQTRISGLATRFGPMVLCEGGPHVLHTLASHDVVDEWFITVSPQLAGSDRRGIVAGTFTPRKLILDRVAEADGFLMLRYLRESQL